MKAIALGLAALLAAGTGFAQTSAYPNRPVRMKQGTVRALAVTGARRSPALPDVPTFAEAGAPDQESDIILGVLVPGGTPRDVIDRLYREIVRIVALPDVRERLSTLGFDPIASTPEEFADRIKWEIDKWAKVIRAADIKMQ